MGMSTEGQLPSSFSTNHQQSIVVTWFLLNCFEIYDWIRLIVEKSFVAATIYAIAVNLIKVTIVKYSISYSLHIPIL